MPILIDIRERSIEILEKVSNAGKEFTLKTVNFGPLCCLRTIYENNIIVIILETKIQLVTVFCSKVIHFL